MFRWYLDDEVTTVFLALPTKPPSPESVQLEGWDGVWGDGRTPYWDPQHVDEVDITHSIIANSSQEYSAVRDVEMWRAQNCQPVPLKEGAQAGLREDDRARMKDLTGLQVHRS